MRCPFRLRSLGLSLLLVGPLAIGVESPVSVPMRRLAADDIEEKRPLDHDDYAKWNTLGSQSVSNDGKWCTFSVSPGEGESTLKVQELKTGKEFSVARGSGARFSFDSQFVIYTVEPDPEVLKKLRKEKKPANELPKPAMEIVHLASGERTTIPAVSRFTMPTKAAGWVAFHPIEGDEQGVVKKSDSGLGEPFVITPEGIRRPEKPKVMREAEEAKPAGKGSGHSEKVSENEAESEKASAGTKDKVASGKKKDKKAGDTLVLRNLETLLEQRFPYVVNYRFSEDGSTLAFATSGPEADDDGVYVVDLETLKKQKIASGLGNYGQVVFSKDGKQIAFTTDRDDYAAKEPAHSIYLWKTSAREAQLVAETKSKGIPEGWVISADAAPQFTDNGMRLLFLTRPKPESEDDESKGEKDPVAKLDIWHWQDPFLQPQQLLQVARDRNQTYQALYDIRTRKVVQLATEQIPSLRVDAESSADVAVGVSPDKYNKMRSWDTQGFSDWYLVSLKTGEATLLAEMTRGTPTLSPSGRYITWWDGEKKTWFAMSTKPQAMKDGLEGPAMGQPVDLGASIGHPLFDELHDTPSLPDSYGSAGWTANDEAVLVYDRWDIWKVDPTGEKPAVCLTNGLGREQNIRFRRTRIDSEERWIDLAQTQYLSAFFHETKASGYYRLDINDNVNQLDALIVLDEDIGGLRKAKDSDTVLFTRSTFQRCPDLWTSTLEFKTTRRLSRINPQQDDYLWGSGELVHWNAQDGQPLDGILYKPEGFDPSKKYPMLVYFYERNSDNLHTYYTPAAGRSIINFSFYVSRGYVLFVPDIPYKVGEPGPSAANAILPGVEHIVSQGFIDPDRIGMQGHSWGGYQTAYLVTVTNMYACAESGAPVSNMTSAYGGIRWGSGMSRMFQYEKTQSRIGATLWEARDKYIANSPLFAADKIETPLLILHNDEDTAVPWYQGIELFVALRRLNRPAWMLNYNGDPHWVMSDENRMDFARRMQQFFDHYLKGDPMPVWMAEGIPAVDKGKEFGFEYVPPAEASPEQSGEAATNE